MIFQRFYIIHFIAVSDHDNHNLVICFKAS